MLDGIQVTEHSDTLYACSGSSLILFCLPVNKDLTWSITGPGGFTSTSRTALIANELALEMFGNYEITYSSPNGCELRKTFVLQVDKHCETNSVHPPKLQEGVEFYPNPVHSTLQFQGLSGESQVEIYNVLGEKCFTGVVSGVDFKMDVSELPDAIYYLVIRDENMVRAGILIKH